MKQSLGEFIAQLRKEKGLTQRELAEHLNVTDKTVSHWERGESSPDISALPLLADIFGITVDELLKREIRQQACTVPQFIPHPPVDGTPHNYRNFKTANIISASLSVMSVISGVGLKYLIAYFTYTQTANGFAFFASLAAVFVSVVLTVIFNIVFKNKLNPHSEAFMKYRFAADRITTLNIYSAVFCLSLVPCFIREHGFIFTLIALAVMLVTEYILSKNGVLSTEKAFESKLKESIYFLRKSCAVLCTVLVILGGGVHFFFSYAYHPTVNNIIFTSGEEFKAYMETPAEKPDNAYLVDGVSVTALATTTLPPTTAPDGSGAPTGQQSPVAVIPQESEAENETEEIYNAKGEVILTFRNLNKAVKTYAYNDETGTFHLITYKEAIRVQKLRTFCNTTLGSLMPLYYLAVAAVTLAVYKTKLKKNAVLRQHLTKSEQRYII